jgi:hypothetical protein
MVMPGDDQVSEQGWGRDGVAMDIRDSINYCSILWQEFSLLQEPPDPYVMIAGHHPERGKIANS